MLAWCAYFSSQYKSSSEGLPPTTCIQVPVRAGLFVGSSGQAGLVQVVERGGAKAAVVMDPRQHWKQLELVSEGQGGRALGHLARNLALAASAAAPWCPLSCTCQIEPALPVPASPYVHTPRLLVPSASPLPPVQVRRLSGEARWAPYLQLRKIKDHFLFTIEATGGWRPHELFNHAVEIMVSKCDKVLEGLQAFPHRSFDY